MSLEPIGNGMDVISRNAIGNHEIVDMWKYVQKCWQSDVVTVIVPCLSGNTIACINNS